MDTTDTWVLAAPFRAHVRYVMECSGVPWRVIAAAAAVPAPTVRSLLGGRLGKLPARSATRLLAVTPATLRYARVELVDAAETARYLRALRGRGLTLRTLGRFVGMADFEVAALVDGTPRCSRLVALHAMAAAEAHGCVNVEDPAVAA